ncbi:MAG: flippase [Candidatus Levyibacteriota bacterium]
MDKVLLKIGYNTSVQLIGKILSVLLSVITIGILTRYLGTSGYGNFTLVFAYMSFFAVIADFGLQLAMVRELADKKETAEKLYGTYFWLKIILVLLSTLLAFIFLLFFPYSPMLKSAILIGGLAVGISGLTGYGTTIFQSNIRLDLVTLVDLVTKITTAALIVLFITIKLGFYSIVSTVLIGNLIGLAVTVVLLKRNINFNFNFDKVLAKKIFLLSLPIGFTTFFSLAYFKLDTIILSVIKDAREVGIYSLAYKILENVIVIWGFYMASVFPLLSKFQANDDRSNFNKLFRNSFFIAVLLSALIMSASYIYAPLIINIFGGRGFAESIISLRILVFAIPVLFINNLLYYRFLIRRNLFPVIIILGLGLMLNSVLNIAYVPKYGYLASSFITVITEFFLFLLLVLTILFKNHRRGSSV